MTKEQDFRDYYIGNIEFLNSALSSCVNLIKSLLKDQIQIENITFRVKNIEECINKFNRKYVTNIPINTNYNIKDYITDLLGIRIICLYIDDISNIQSIIEENFEKIEITDKTAIIEKTDDKFGYKGLHLDIKLNNNRINLPEYSVFKDLKFELQIRTIIQDAWSVLDHKINYKKNIKQPSKRKINRLSALFEIADEEFMNIRKETTDKDVFEFISTVRKFFPFYNFTEYVVSIFVKKIKEIKEISPTFIITDLYDSLENNITLITDYFEKNNPISNPFEKIRHIIYLSNKNDFKLMLSEIELKNFNDWLSQNNISSKKNKKRNTKTEHKMQ